LSSFVTETETYTLEIATTMHVDNFILFHYYSYHALLLLFSSLSELMSLFLGR